MSAKRKRAVLSIKDKQTIISLLDKGEKGTNLAQEYSISKQQISDIRKDNDKNLKSTDSIDTSEGLKWIIDIHVFDYLGSRLSGLFIEVPTSPDHVEKANIAKTRSQYNVNTRERSRSRSTHFRRHVFIKGEAIRGVCVGLSMTFSITLTLLVTRTNLKRLILPRLDHNTM